MTKRLSVLASVLLVGCGLLRTHEDTARSEAEVFHVSGRVVVDVDRHVPIVVALLRTQPDTPELVVTDHQQLFHPGPYDFLVTAGRYRVVAFEDANGDLAFDDHERCNSYDDFRELIVDGTHPTVADLRIGDASYLDRALPPIAMGDAATRGIAIGDVVAHDDPRLAEASGVMGAWEPVRFMEEGRAGIFQLEAHVPSRTPVLFVHGFAGWGHQFDPAIDALDRTRFEPWIAAYPSGWALDDVARLFRAALNEMLTVTGAENVCLVAHSMGGLVTWRMLTLDDGDLVDARVHALVTLASPIGGHPSAARGLHMSPVIVPAWRDLAPESELVRAVAGSHLSRGLRYTLLFAFTPAHDGDGVLPLATQLPRFAQDAATRVAGFETTHVGILSDTHALVELQHALDACVQPSTPPACTTLPPTLTAYDAITAGVAFSLEIARDANGAWSPTHALDMPMHHASTITWTDDAHALDAAAPGPVVVIARGLGRLSIEQDTTRGQFFATYGARVEHVCPLSP